MKRCIGLLFCGTLTYELFKYANEKEISNNRWKVICNYLQLLKAKELGYEVHCFAWRDGAVCEAYADYFYPISIVEKDGDIEGMYAYRYRWYHFHSQ